MDDWGPKRGENVLGRGKKPAHTKRCDIGNSQQFSRVRAVGVV